MANDIAFFKDVFDARFCTFLLNDARAALTRDGAYGRSNFHWQEEIRKSSAPVLVREHEPVLKALILEKLMKRGVVQHDRFKVMTYAWTRLSYIPWHDDSRHSEAVTVYLNDIWELDWGGLFLYSDKAGEIRGVAPVFNTGLRNRNNIMHSTSLVSIDAPEPRFTLQLFAAKE